METDHKPLESIALKPQNNALAPQWPENISEVPECLHVYYSFQPELTVQNHLVLKGDRVIIPTAMHRKMVTLAHESHIGIKGCIRRARESMYWPRMTTKLKEYISKCDTCLTYRASQSKVPLIQHDIGERPWGKISADLCELPGCTLLVVSDYYSNFVEVERVHKANTSGVTKVLKPMFARYGVPHVLVSDIGLQFDSAEFKNFSKSRGFEHNTLSPGYPQAEENAVKKIKQLFKKCSESGESEYLASLNWRNTPTEGMGTSPAQRFFGSTLQDKTAIGEKIT